ncbi:MAG: AI-2E family transporter [Pseudomonadota bacterium]
MTWPRWAIPVLVLIGFFLFVSAVKGILLPFVAGLAIAYLFDPLADKLEALGLKRWMAVGVILISFFVFIIGFVVLLAPLVSQQIGALLKYLPQYVSDLRVFIDRLLEQAGQDRVEGFAEDYAGKIVGIAGDAASRFISGSLQIFNVISLLLLTPLVAFYVLRDWDLMIAHIDSWLPREHHGTIRTLTREVDDALSGFVRGQLLVASIMGTLYAIGWSVIGLDYAVVLGIIAALLCFIPYIGPLTGSLLALLVGFGQFGDDWVRLGAILGIHLGVQLLEGNFLTPRLVGQRVGLDDVWVIFAVLAGAELMGFLGILIAVPFAAIIAVLLRFGLKQYLSSDLYGGPHEPLNPDLLPQPVTREDGMGS